jgi:hypothetical protein
VEEDANERATALGSSPHESVWFSWNLAPQPQVLSRRHALLRVLFEQEPFLGELEEVKAFPLKLFELAWRSRAIARPDIGENDLQARAYLYLLIPIGRWVPYAAIIDRPAWVTAQAAEDAMVAIFCRLLI